MINPRRAAAILAACAGVMAAMFGWDIGGQSAKGVVLAVVFALGAYFALVLLDQGLAHMRAKAYDLGWMAIGAWAFIVGLEIVGHVGFNATARLDNIEQAGLQQTSYADSRAQVALLEKQEAQIDAQSRWDSRPVASVIADMDKAKVSPRWTSTNGCQDVTAKRSRDFCAAYASLVAEKANAEEAMVNRQELDVIRKNLAAARLAANGEAGNTHVSGAASQGLVLASAFTLTRKPGDDAVYWANLIFSLATAIFMVLSGIIWAVFPPTATSPRGEAADHPDVMASLRYQAAALAAKSREMMDPPDLAKRKFLGAIAAPGGGITPMSRLESGINWRSAA